MIAKTDGNQNRGFDRLITADECRQEDVEGTRASVETIPPAISRNTKQIEVIVRTPLSENLSLPRLFVDDPVFTGTCTLSRKVP